MNKLTKFLVVAALLLVISALVVPASAQDDGDGEKVGGIITEGNFGEGPATFSPIYCTATDCADIVNYMFPLVFGVDVEAGVIAPNQPGTLAIDWTVSEDNLVYTVNLRQDWTWSDGTPITANDVIFNWELMNNELVAHPDSFVLEEIESVEALDDYTLQFTVKSPTCRALLSLAGVRPIPAHVFSQFSPEELQTIDFNLAPDVTAGPYSFAEFRPGELTVLVANDDYVDAELGYVNNDGYVQRVFADQTVLIEAFLGGDLTFLENPAPDRKADIRAADGVQIYDFAGNTWDYLAFNTADPENPQPRLDEAGNVIDQGLHPIFSDKLVRQALAHAVDVDAIIEGAVFGEGSRMAAHITPSSWAYNENLAPRAYDPAIALELLAEAGWVPNDSGQLVCQDCLYAREVDAEFNGSPFEFELLTNSGNTRREAIGLIVQDALADLGITVNFQTIEFNTLLDIMDAQTFDSFILGWRAGYPDSPDTIQLFGAQSDILGGSNFTSFYNEEYYALEEQALNVPGCDEAERKVFYDQMQEIMYDEMPYIWMFVQDGMYAAQGNLVNFDPRPQALRWNIDTWALNP